MNHRIECLTNDSPRPRAKVSTDSSSLTNYANVISPVLEAVLGSSFTGPTCAGTMAPKSPLGTVVAVSCHHLHLQSSTQCLYSTTVSPTRRDPVGELNQGVFLLRGWAGDITTAIAVSLFVGPE